MGTAGTQAAGLWQFLLDATHSKQVHTGKACFDGILSALLASEGLLGPHDILEGRRGMGATLSSPQSINPLAIDQDIGTKWSILGSSFKWHAACRHTHPSVDALLHLMKEQEISFDDIDSISVRTYKAAIDILSLSEDARTVHQSKFSMGFVLAVAARNMQAMITDFNEDALHDEAYRSFQRRVTMILDPEMERMFPEKWLGSVEVKTKRGQNFSQTVKSVKGDPDQPLSR